MCVATKLWQLPVVFVAIKRLRFPDFFAPFDAVVAITIQITVITLLT